MTITPLQKGGLIRLPDVLKYIPVSRSTWWDYVKRGIFPAPIHLTPRTTAWRVDDILELIERMATGEKLTGGVNV